MCCRQAEAGKRRERLVREQDMIALGRHAIQYPLNVRIHRIPYRKISTKYIVPDYLLCMGAQHVEVASAPITYHGGARKEQVDSSTQSLAFPPAAASLA